MPRPDLTPTPSDGSKLKPPMAYDDCAALTETDLNDIIAYLRTVPPLQ